MCFVWQFFYDDVSGKLFSASRSLLTFRFVDRGKRRGEIKTLPNQEEFNESITVALFRA